jgi:threonine aldolase
VNSVFASLPRPAIDALQAWSFFWDWDQAADEVRWMTGFDTTVEDLDRFAAGVDEALRSVR